MANCRVLDTDNFTRTQAFKGVSGHSGIDLAPDDKSRRTYVTAHSAGTVVDATWHKGVKGMDTYGSLVTIQHSNGYYTAYAHMKDEGENPGEGLKVKIGDYVQRGDILGVVGTTGNSTGLHLHFEVRTGPTTAFAIEPKDYVTMDLPGLKIELPEFTALMNKYIATKEKQAASTWAVSSRDWCKSKGITDASAPQMFARREEFWQFLNKFFPVTNPKTAEIVVPGPIGGGIINYF